MSDQLVADNDDLVRRDEAVERVRSLRESFLPAVETEGVTLDRLSPTDAVAFATPGKPLGAHTVATLIARPFFTGERPALRATDTTVSAVLARDVGLGPDGFECVVPVTLTAGTDGLRAMPLCHADSPLSVYEETFDPSVLSSPTRATRADGVVLTTADLAAGDEVAVVHSEVLE